MQLKTRNNFVDLINKKSLKKGIEIGVQNGNFSDVLLRSTLQKLYLVDCWDYQPQGYVDGANVDQNRQNLIYNNIKIKYQNNKRVNIIKDFSINASSLFPDNYFDFVYIDANHSFEAVMQDLESWYPKVKLNGVIAGHDYLDDFASYTKFGVKSAVDKFFQLKHKKVMSTMQDVPYISWYCFK